MKIEELERALRQALEDPLPGMTAQSLMIPHPRIGHRVYKEVEDRCLRAGVLILFYPKDGRPHFVLTRRTDHLLHHQAQISLPGGRQEEGESFEQTALREACEELGLASGKITVLGRTTPLYIPPSNYCIYPVVAVAFENQVFHPAEEEVAEVIEMPVVRLIDPKTVRHETWTLRGEPVRVPFFFFKGFKIWGATAMVLAEMKEILRGI